MLLLVIILYAVTAGMLFGANLGSITSALPLMQNDTSLALDDLQAEIVVGHCKFGAAIGALAGVWLLGGGHIRCFWLSGLGFVAGPLVMACADTWGVLAVGRLVSGLAVGLSAVATPTYLADVAPASSRGCIVGLYELALSSGLLVTGLVNTLLTLPSVQSALYTALPGVETWRVMLAVPALPALPYVFGCLCLPEAPSTLVATGRYQEAFSVLVRLHREPNRSGTPSSGQQPPRLSGTAQPSRGRPSAAVLAPIGQHGSNCSSGTNSCTNSQCSAASDRLSTDGLIRFTTTGSSGSQSFTDLPLSPSQDVLAAHHTLASLVVVAEGGATSAAHAQVSAASPSPLRPHPAIAAHGHRRPRCALTGDFV